MLHVNAFIQIPDTELDFSAARSSGPGGQNVNKVNSKVVMRWNVRTSPSINEGVRARFIASYGTRLTTEGELVLASEQFRDQPMNREACLEKLREMLLAVAFPPKARKKTKPTRGSKERRKQDKRSRGDVKKGRGRVRLD